MRDFTYPVKTSNVRRPHAYMYYTPMGRTVAMLSDRIVEIFLGFRQVKSKARNTPF